MVGPKKCTAKKIWAQRIWVKKSLGQAQNCIGPKDVWPKIFCPIYFGSKFDQNHISVLAEIYHYNGTMTNAAGTNAA